MARNNKIAYLESYQGEKKLYELLPFHQGKPPGYLETRSTAMVIDQPTGRADTGAAYKHDETLLVSSIRNSGQRCGELQPLIFVNCCRSPIIFIWSSCSR